MKQLFIACLLTAAVCVAHAQAGDAVPSPAAAASAPGIPVAHTQTTAFINAQLRDVYAPLAGTWKTDTAAATDALTAYCSADAAGSDAKRMVARNAWTQAMLTWTRLSTIAIGPLLTRRSEARVDFYPLRVPALEKQLAGATASTQWDVAQIGAQARGLSALEWLLWTKPAAPRSPACRYAVLLARDVQAEADALSADFAALAKAQLDDAATVPVFNEYINQWLSGMSRLRWRELEMPVRNWGLNQAPRAASGNTAAAWAARWAALRRPPLVDYLRARGLVDPAAALERDLKEADTQLAGITPATPAPKLLAASKQVDVAAHTMTDNVAQALQVTIEFSSDDGD